MEKKKVLKIILGIIVLIVIACAIYFIRNYIIINKIATKQSEITSSNNYSYISELYTGEDKTVIEYYYKDGININILKKNNIESEVIWYDENNKEQITMQVDKLTANVSNTENGFKCSMPSQIVENNINDKIDLALRSLISYDEVNGEKCYAIKRFIGVTTTIPYVSVKNGEVLKIALPDNKAIEYKEFKINNLTDEDVKRPDLTDYKVTYNK